MLPNVHEYFVRGAQRSCCIVLDTNNTIVRITLFFPKTDICSLRIVVVVLAFQLSSEFILTLPVE